jgi:peroxiredoxin
VKGKLIVGLAIVTCAVTAGALGQHQTQGSTRLLGKAPFFSAPGADGKTYDIKTLTKNGPVYLLFIKKDCPVTAEAIGYYMDIYKAYGKKAPMVGILNGEASEYKDYIKDHKLPFPTVLDPKQSLITSYKVENSPWMVEVSADGTVGRIWQGYSQDYLNEINKAVAEGAGVPAAKIIFKDAPKEPTYG